MKITHCMSMDWDKYKLSNNSNLKKKTAWIIQAKKESYNKKKRKKMH